MNRKQSKISGLALSIGLSASFCIFSLAVQGEPEYGTNIVNPATSKQAAGIAEDLPSTAKNKDEGRTAKHVTKGKKNKMPEDSSGKNAESQWHTAQGYALYRSAPGTELKELPGNRLQLDRGEVVIEPTHPVLVLTPLSETHLLHKAAVLFRVQKGGERVMDLWDSGPDSVIVISHRRKLPLGPGKEAYLADHDPSYREISEPDDIGRRRIKLHEVAKHKQIVTSEFSLLQALQRDPLLYDVAHSSDKQDHSLRAHILKTAAVLNLVTSGHGYYTNTSGF